MIRIACTGVVLAFLLTVLRAQHLLGYQILAAWQGRSLFDSRRHGRLYLFGPYSGLFGYREGS